LPQAGNGIGPFLSSRQKANINVVVFNAIQHLQVTMHSKTDLDGINSWCSNMARMSPESLVIAATDAIQAHPFDSRVVRLTFMNDLTIRPESRPLFSDLLPFDSEFSVFCFVFGSWRVVR
jgi:hypothetical protein